MAVLSWRGHEIGKPVQELQGREINDAVLPLSGYHPGWIKKRGEGQLRTAQLAFIKARRGQGGTAADHPYFWAAYGTTGR